MPTHEEFSAFCEKISAPSLRAVAEHWDRARGSKQLPAWQDLRPESIAAHLPIIWSYKYEPLNSSFRGRLAGDRIVQLYGKSFRGLLLEEASSSPEGYTSAKAIFFRVIDAPAAYHAMGRIFKFSDKFGLGERIMLPLSSEGSIADEVFGATECRQLDVTQQQPVEAILEDGDWFSL